MKCVAFILFPLIFPILCEANWCIKNITLNIQITKVLSRTKTYRTWLHGVQQKSETYRVTEFLPKVKHQRVCCEGYVLDILRRRCIPTCSEECPRLAKCVGPNTCACQIGYQLEEGRCEPICDPACDENSHCTAPNECSCKFRYERKSSDGLCEPWCKNDCRNGFCLGPDLCICNSRFVKLSDGNCVPECRRHTCLFGSCSNDQVCHCWEGYEYDESILSCRPIHDEEQTTILYSTELPDEITTVYPGNQETTSGLPNSQEILSTTNEPTPTELTTKSFETLMHELICSLNCMNGDCEGRVCVCNEGFVRADSSCVWNRQGYSFRPDLQCVEKSMCQEYLPETTEVTSSSEETSSTLFYDTSTIKSESSDCINGTCQCPEGLIFIETTKRCVLSCELACKDGICTENGACNCLDGYEHLNGVGCVPLCEPECINSICVAPQQCQHQRRKGFQPKTDNSYERSADLKLTEVTEKVASKIGVPRWLYGFLMVAFMATVGLFIFRALRRGSYNVGDEEKRHEQVKFRNNEEPVCVI